MSRTNREIVASWDNCTPNPQPWMLEQADELCDRLGIDPFGHHAATRWADAVRMLSSFLDAYPEDLFPSPPEQDRAKDAAAADVLRRVAHPIVRDVLDLLCDPCLKVNDG